MSGLTFILLTFLTFYLIWSFFYGYKKNIKLSKDISKILEELFKPRDKSYTWLGGAIGFRAIYKVSHDFVRQVLVNLRLQPRQSALYYLLKLLILRGIKDNLQVLYFLKEKINYEFHAIKKGYNPKIFNTNLNRKESENVYFLFSKDFKKDLAQSLEKIISNSKIKHIAITPDRNVVYFEFDFENIQDIKNTFNHIFNFINQLKTFLAKRGK